MKKVILFSLVFLFSQFLGLAQEYGQKVYAPDASSANYFGRSVSLFGDYAFIGATGAFNDTKNTGAGAVYVFQKEDESWNFLEKIVEPGLRSKDYYGYAVDHNADYAIVGDPEFANKGAVWVYKRDGNNWERQLQLPEYGSTEFGYSLAIDDDLLVVGAPESVGWGPSYSYRGAAWIFEKTGSGKEETWTEVTKIAASDGWDYAYFGYDVDISDNYIIAGAWTASANYYGRSAAYIYEFEDGTWIEKQRLFPNGVDTTTNNFGKCVAISGQYAAVGAPEEIDQILESSAVYIFEKIEGQWQETAKLTSPDTNDKYYAFGRSVELQDNRIIVGAMKAVYIYENDDTGAWQLIDSVHNDYYNNGFVYVQYGSCVSLHDSSFLVGAYDDCGLEINAGAAHFYNIRPDSVSAIYEPGINENIQFYPNPLSDILYLDNLEPNSKILIHNSLGVKIKELNLSNANSIDFSDFKKGVYYLSIMDENTGISTLCLIRE